VAQSCALYLSESGSIPNEAGNSAVCLPPLNTFKSFWALSITMMHPAETDGISGNAFMAEKIKKNIIMN
jgi:hypothetical protein